MSITKRELREELKSVLKEELKDFVKRDELKGIIKEELSAVHEKIDNNHQEVMELVHEFSSHVEERFQQIESDMSGMVTKEHFDEQMTELRGDFVIHGARKDRKVTTVVDLLVEKKLFTPHDRKRVFGVESFE